MTDFKQFAGFDLLIGGSPCQGFSSAGKGLNFSDPRSQLFFEFVRAKREMKPRWFMLENVKMKKEWLAIIDEHMGVKSVCINSALVSAQNRMRHYWCNWAVEQPADRGITWGDVREYGVDESAMYYSARALGWLRKHGERKAKELKIHGLTEKMQMLEASMHKKYSSQRFFGILDNPHEAIGAMRGRRINPATGTRDDYNMTLPLFQYIEYREDGKTNCLSTVQKDNVVVPFVDKERVLETDIFYRYITPIECERLQTLPDDYTAGASNSQRYKMLCNGWTVEVIAHIFEQLKNKIV
jgi:DNA-cytosine methyltransferase